MTEIIRPDFRKRSKLPCGKSAPITAVHGEHDPFCAHEYVAVLGHRRVVLCRVCRLQLDPFDVLSKLAREWDNATWLERERAEAHAAIGALKKEIANLKAQRRRASRRTA